MKVFTTSYFWCLGNRCLASGAVVILAKRGGLLALEDANGDGVGYLGGGVLCLVKGSKGGSILETGARFHGTVDGDRCSQRVRGQRRGHQAGGK